MIAITGVGAVCALGRGADAVFDALCAGRTGIGPAWPDAPPLAVVSGGPHLGADLALEAVREALGDLTGVGLVGASTAGDMAEGEPAYREVLEGAEVSPAFLWTQLADSPTARVARALGLTGPRLTLSTACTSGAAAIGVAADWVRSGRVPAVVAFGVDALCGTTVYGFRSLGLTSPDRCRPFDVARDGMTVGEGAGAVLLESAAHADARGAEVLAWLAGYGSAGDAHHMTAPHPDGAGARRAIAAAEPGTVDYVNAHGTATELNDAVEAAVLADLFPGVPISSTKGATGHTLGAAGALEAVITVQALRRGVVPPNVGLREGIAGLDLVRQARQAALKRALTVNLAFGGSCTALVLEAA